MRTSIASLRFAYYLDLYNIHMYVIMWKWCLILLLRYHPNPACAFTVLIATYFIARTAIPMIVGSNYI